MMLHCKYEQFLRTAHSCDALFIVLAPSVVPPGKVDKVCIHTVSRC